ncbi:WecB/TagA/CpsF family glycosyltransferase [Halanaerobaculum tunisiense]
MIDQVNILGVAIDQVTREEALTRIEELVETESLGNLVVTPNAEMIMQATKNQTLQEIINSAQLRVPDGAGVVLASHLLGQPLAQRVAGIDLVQQLLARGNKMGYTFYFLGAASGVAREAKKRVLADYSQLDILTHHGYLDHQAEKEVVAELQAQEIDILLVGMGVPLQEKWLATYLDELQIPVGIGVGGTFDILAGKKTRAPVMIQQLGLEWLYRLLQEPKRLSRIKALPEFIYQVVVQRLKRGK